jgi:hypothetical protein
MSWPLKALFCTAIFHGLACIHDINLVAQLGNNPKVVCYEQHGYTQIADQLFQQIQNLELRCHVQSGCGFIRND